MKKYYKIVDGQTKFATTQSKVKLKGKWVINPTEEMLIADGWQEYNAPKKEPTLESAIESKIADIDAYDHSDAVNSFMLNGKAVWLSKADRVGLMNSLDIERASGRNQSVLWFNGERYELPIVDAMDLLADLELYALDCYNTTAEHKANVNALTTIEEIEAYNYKTNYPQKLIINL